MSEPYRVTTVCWGNICRSPMTEFVLRAAFRDAGLDGQVVVDSAGTSAEELGNPMDRRTITALRRHGVPDSGFADHRARRFAPEWFATSDLILAADHIHVDRLRALARAAGVPDPEGRIRLVRSFDPASVARGDLGMDDPWYGGDADFDRTYAEIRAAVPGIVDHVRAESDARN